MRKWSTLFQEFRRVATSGVERPPFLVELTLQDKRIALLFASASGNLTTNDFRLSDAWFDLYLISADWQR